MRSRGCSRERRGRVSDRLSTSQRGEGRGTHLESLQRREPDERLLGERAVEDGRHLVDRRVVLDRLAEVGERRRRDAAQGRVPGEGRKEVADEREARERRVGALARVERHKVERERELLHGVVALGAGDDADAAGAQNLADEGRGVGERTGVERLLLGEVPQLEQDARHEVGEGLGAEVVGDDLGLDAAQDGDAERDLEDAEPVRADVGQALVRLERLVRNERRRLHRDDGERLLDHGREVLAHELGAAAHEAQGELEPALEARERGGDLGADLVLERELLLEREPVLLRELGRDGLLARERLAQLGLPQRDLVLLRVGLADRRRRLGLVLGRGEHVDERLARRRAPDTKLGRADEGEVRRLEVVLELGEQGRDRLGRVHERERRRGAVRRLCQARVALGRERRVGEDEVEELREALGDELLRVDLCAQEEVDPEARLARRQARVVRDDDELRDEVLARLGVDAHALVVVVVVVERDERVEERTQPAGAVDGCVGRVVARGDLGREGDLGPAVARDEPGAHAVAQGEVHELGRVRDAGAHELDGLAADVVRGALGRAVEDGGGERGAQLVVGGEEVGRRDEEGRQGAAQPRAVLDRRRLAVHLVVQEEVGLGALLAERLHRRVGGDEVVCER